MKKIAIYGKGGIGKSTTSANLSAAFSEMGHKVCQIGCDPKNDSTRLLLGRICRETVLDMVRESEDGEVTAAQIIHTGFNGIQCVEAGGPEPGVGCAGRGIIVALEKIRALGAIAEEQLVIYDVLGDVVCGGFAVPIREGYATDIYIVSSLIMYIPRDKVVNQAEVQRKTVIEWAPESNQADIYRTLAKKMDTNEDLRIPEPLSFEELEELVYKYGN